MHMLKMEGPFSCSFEKKIKGAFHINKNTLGNMILPGPACCVDGSSRLAELISASAATTLPSSDYFGMTPDVSRTVLSWSVHNAIISPWE
jgi:hypothetical protein